VSPLFVTHARAATTEDQTMETPSAPRKLPYILLLLSILLLLAGINAGEVASVWEKAVRICYSCIGIG